MTISNVFAGRLLLLALSLGVLLRPGALQAQAAGSEPVPLLFHTSDRCMACHNHLTAPSGEDVSIGFEWRSSMMGNAGRDPYWQASVRRETMEHPGAADAIEDKCTICHLAMARTQAVAEGGQGRAFQNFPWAPEQGPYAALAVDGVSCTACHQIRSDRLGDAESFTGGYVIDLRTPMGQRPLYGPFEAEARRASIMGSSSEFHPVLGSHIQSAEFCATCHTLYTHALGPDGKEVGELPEQVPYLEWKESAYAGVMTCQQCHMPEVPGRASVTSVLGNLRSQVNRHSFRGGNFFMPRLLNRFRNELGVKAMPLELEATAKRAEENLRGRAASVEVTGVRHDGGTLGFEVVVRNLAGHKFPSAYPSRRAWLHVEVLGRDGRRVFESGALRPDGSIQGNDNDEDGSRFEPHYRVVQRPDQVQIYEDIMTDYAGRVTTGLVWGAQYVKDNRLLPAGFEKSRAPEDVAVRGRAREDENFGGGEDRVRYEVAVAADEGPFRVKAELWYQPIGYRWAVNLKGFDTEESKRFARYFDALAGASAVLVAEAVGGGEPG